MSREDLTWWWHTEIATRVPKSSGIRTADVKGSVRIARDEWGIPHLFADNDDDLFFAFGYATAQGPAVSARLPATPGAGTTFRGPRTGCTRADLVARTVGLHLIAEQEWESLPEENTPARRRLLERNQCAHQRERRQTPDRIRPARISSRSLAAAGFAGDRRRVSLVSDRPLSGDCDPRTGEADFGNGSPCTKPFCRPKPTTRRSCRPGSYPAVRAGTQPVGVSVNDPAEGHGSNNWVVSGPKRSLENRWSPAIRTSPLPPSPAGTRCTVRRLVQCRRHGLRRDAGRHVREERTSRLGHHQ